MGYILSAAAESPHRVRRDSKSYMTTQSERNLNGNMAPTQLGSHKREKMKNSYITLAILGSM